MILPGIGSRQFAKVIAKRIADNAVTDRASRLSYYFLFSLFPFLFTLVTLAAYLPVQGAIDELLARLDPLMPQAAMSIIRDQLTALTTQQRPHLLTFGLLLAVWSASRGVDALRTALNLSYDVKESRPWWRVQAIAIVITIATSALMLFAIAVLALGSGAGVWLAGKLHVDQYWALLWTSLLRVPRRAPGPPSERAAGSGRAGASRPRSLLLLRAIPFRRRLPEIGRKHRLSESARPLAALPSHADGLPATRKMRR